MTYHAKYENRPGYLFVLIEGEECFDEAMAFWEDMLKEADTRNYNTLLVKDELKGLMTPQQVYQFCAQMARKSHGKTIAYVDGGKPEAYEMNLHGETVAINRGVNARLFKTEEEAVKWIRWNMGEQ